MVLSASSERRRDLCIRRRGLSSVGEGAHGGRQAAFLQKAGRMADLAPDGRARLAGKKGTDIGEVRGEGAIFLRETKRRAACSERKLAFNSGEGGSGKKGARRFCRKRAARRKRMSACGRGNSAGKREGLYRTERARAKRKAAICSGGDRRRGCASLYGKNKAAFRAAVPKKNKTPTDRGFGSASGGPHPHYFKGSEAVSFCFRRR